VSTAYEAGAGFPGSASTSSARSFHTPHCESRLEELGSPSSVTHQVGAIRFSAVDGGRVVLTAFGVHGAGTVRAAAGGGCVWWTKTCGSVLKRVEGVERYRA